jgi:hypothetical protein
VERNLLGRKTLPVMEGRTQRLDNARSSLVNEAFEITEEMFGVARERGDGV